MKRRDFLQFMGVSTASIAASTALAKIPEAENQIILLDTPKELIISKTIPEVDFVIKRLVSIKYRNEENVQIYESISADVMSFPSVGSQQINIECEFEFYQEEVNLFKHLKDPRTFTFNLDMNNDYRYAHLMELNGRKFMLSSYEIKLEHDSFMRYSLTGIDI